MSNNNSKAVNGAVSNNTEALIAKIKKQLENFDTVILKEDEAKALIAALERSQRESEQWRREALSNLNSASRYKSQLEASPLAVKLPSLKQSVSGERYAWSDGVFNFKADVIAALSAAGITVQGDE